MGTCCRIGRRREGSGLLLRGGRKGWTKDSLCLICHALHVNVIRFSILK
jgi:hypothetical protein